MRSRRRIYLEGIPSLLSTSLLVTSVPPCKYPKDAALTSHVEDVEFAFLTCVSSPDLTAIEYSVLTMHALYTG